MSMPDAEFGWVVVVVKQPAPHPDRFYGPFCTEADARRWMDSQPFSATSTVGMIPLRRPDIVRQNHDFYSPTTEYALSEFWLAEVADGDSDAI